MADVVFNLFKKVLLDRSDTGAGVDFDSDTLKLILVTSVPTTTATTGNQDAWAFYSDVNTEVATAGGYTAGGITLGSPAVTTNLASDRAEFAATNAGWTGTITAAAAILYKSTGTGTTSRLIGWWDFGGSKSSSGGAFTLSWTSNLMLTLT